MIPSGLSAEEIDVALNEHEQYNQGQYPGQVSSQPSGHFSALSGVDFFKVIVESPTMAGNAEQQVYQRSERKQVITEYEIFKIEYAGACSEGLEPAENIESQNTRHRKNDKKDRVDDGGFLPAPSPKVHGKGDYILKYRYDGRICGKGHENEEQGSPYPSAGHGVENMGKGHEYKPGTFAGVNAECKTGREYDQPGDDRNKCVKHGNVDGFTKKAAFFTNVTSEYREGADA